MSSKLCRTPPSFDQTDCVNIQDQGKPHRRSDAHADRLSHQTRESEDSVGSVALLTI